MDFDWSYARLFWVSTVCGLDYCVDHCVDGRANLWF